MSHAAGEPHCGGLSPLEVMLRYFVLCFPRHPRSMLLRSAPRKTQNTSDFRLLGRDLLGCFLPRGTVVFRSGDTARTRL